MGFTVVTYGGGEILKNIFNAIAMLMNGNGGFLQPIMIITISIGTIWAVTKALFTPSTQAFLGQFIFPLIAITGLLMVPTSTVHIEDLFKNSAYKVDHVPFLLAKFAELSSSLGYHFTTAMEKAMHVPDDVSYNSTGMIFGADTAMQIDRYKIANADLEKNLRTFCRQCILYDLHLGRYTIDELKKATDLWKFLEERTSKVNMMKYESNEKKSLSNYLSCKEAIKKMTPFFEQEKRYHGQLDVCQNLGLTFQALTGLQKNAEELIGQQLMINVLSDEFSGNRFASSRAYLQQRNTYQTLGSLASSSLVTLRAVIEALVYAAFIFVIPLAVLPGGFKIITTWASLIVWIQLWPPFYAILNYIMQSVAHGYANKVFHGLSSTQQGLSLFTSFGLHNLQQDIFALSGYLAASIPFITYAILKGGVSSFVHLASSMMSPAHSAASTAAAEQTSGNYSFANTSLGQISYKNTSGLQTNLAPALSGGFFHENTGLSSTLHGPDEHILRQSNSELRTSLFSEDSISQSLQTSKMHAESTLDTAQKSYLEGLSTHTRNLSDLSTHLANSENYTSGLCQREAYDLQESARYCQNAAENWGKTYGLNTRASMEALLGVGFDFLGNGAKTSTMLGSNKEEALSSAQNILKSEEFQKHFQKLQDISSSESYGLLDETGKRLVESCSSSYEQMQSSQHSFQSAQSNLNQISENATWAEANSHLIRHSLNQDFINWASRHLASQGGFSKVEEIVSKGDASSLINDFIAQIRTKNLSASTHYEEPITLHDLPQTLTLSDAQHNLQNHKQSFSSYIPEKRNTLSSSYQQSKEHHDTRFNQLSSQLENSQANTQQHFDSESARSLYLRPLTFAADETLSQLTPILSKLKIPLPNKSIANGLQTKEQPFWLSPHNSPPNPKIDQNE